MLYDDDDDDNNDDLTDRQSMSLGTGAINSWWGPSKNTLHSEEVPRQWEPSMQVAMNQHHHTKETSIKKLAWRDTHR